MHVRLHLLHGGGKFHERGMLSMQCCVFRFYICFTVLYRFYIFAGAVDGSDPDSILYMTHNSAMWL